MKLFKSVSKKTSRRQSLQNHIDAKNWDKFREMLAGESKKDMEKSLSKTDFVGQSYLHHICSMRAPIDVVRSCVELCPNLAYDLDCFDRSSLHHAVGWGSSPEVVRFLLELNSEAAHLQDADGKTPLHMAFCESGDGVYDTGSEETNKGPLMSVVMALCEVAPNTVNMEDEDGITPLEYAIEKGADSKTMSFLQKVSVLDWKIKKSKNRSMITQIQVHIKEIQSEEIEKSEFLNRDHESEKSAIDVNDLVKEGSENCSLEVVNMQRRLSYQMMMEERKRRKDVPSDIEIPSDSNWDSRVSDVSLW